MGAGSCKHLVLQFRPDSGDRCTGESCVIGIQTIGKGVPQEESKAALSQGHCRKAVKYIEKMAKMVEGGGNCRMFYYPAVYAAQRRLYILMGSSVLGYWASMIDDRKYHRLVI